MRDPQPAGLKLFKGRRNGLDDGFSGLVRNASGSPSGFAAGGLFLLGAAADPAVPAFSLVKPHLPPLASMGASFFLSGLYTVDNYSTGRGWISTARALIPMLRRATEDVSTKHYLDEAIDRIQQVVSSNPLDPGSRGGALGGSRGEGVLRKSGGLPLDRPSASSRLPIRRCGDESRDATGFWETSSGPVGTRGALNN